MYVVEYYLFNRLEKKIFNSFHEATEFCINTAPFESVRAFYLLTDQ